MTEVIFSKHAKEQIEIRKIPLEVVMKVLADPQKIIIEEGKKICQSIIKFDNEGEYLVRVFVNIKRNPNIIITVYRTSKFDKYYEG